MQHTWVWHKPSWRSSPLKLHHGATRTYTGLGKQNLEGTNRTLCTPGPRRKEQWPYKRLTQTCPWVSRSLWRRCGSAVACCRVGALSVAVRSSDLLKEVPIIFIASTIVWPQVNNRKGTQPHPSTENWIGDLLSLALPIRTDPVSPSVSLSHQEASISLLSFSIRGQTDWKPQSQKTNQSDQMDHSLV